MKKLVCNYSVIRFLPYPETREFVNVGILACCPQIGWMDYIIEERKTKRVRGFFPELDINMYTAGRQHVMTKLKRLVGEFKLADANQLAFDSHRKQVAAIFAEIIRPREEIFCFGDPATLLVTDLNRDIKALFNHYVERYFAKAKDYQESIMTKRLTEIFRQNNLLRRYRTEKIGTDDYHVTLPFVEMPEDNRHPLRALKPLNLSQSDATKIRDHGDAWVAKVDRLIKMQFMPRDMLFAVRYPPAEQTKQLDAANEITQLLETKSGVVVEDFKNRKQLMHFAAQA
jgi:hypothetical protein